MLAYNCKGLDNFNFNIMGRKIFVSYKYADRHVQHLPNTINTTARDYVDRLQDLIEETDNIYQGEDDGEDMSSLEDATIGSKLGDKIFDSSVTLVLISKGMREENKPEKDQWIPWEISYSLKEQSRQGERSRTNAVLAVVLPDENERYDYFITDNRCGNCCCRTLNTSFLFEILQENMFNIKNPTLLECNKNSKVYTGESSFIKSVKWKDINNKESFNKYLDIAIEIRNHINDYDIRKNIK